MFIRRSYPFALVIFAVALSAEPLLGQAQEAVESLGALLSQMQPRPFYNEAWKGCGEITALFVPIGGGTWTTDTRGLESGSEYGEDGDYGGSYQAILHAGMRAAGYGVLGHGFQLGGYAAADVGRMSYSMSEATEVSDTRPVALDSSAGIAIKWGTIAKRKLFYGVGFDIGVVLHHADVKNADLRPQAGVVLSPRMLFEGPGGKKDAWAFVFALGLAVSVVDGRAFDSTDRISTRWFRFEPVLQLGVAFGG